MGETKIRLEGVNKVFGRGDTPQTLQLVADGLSKDDIQGQTGQVVGVADATCDIPEGEIFVVMGLSGSGKSTLIRCINRLIEPTSGEIWIDGVDVVTLQKDELLEFRRRKIGMVFQHFGLFPHRSVLDNAGYGLKVQGVDEAERNERAQEALELVGLGKWGDYMPDNLSGGMKQRVGLARALATDPDILLMDEAFSALDPLIKRQMQNELMQLQERVQKTIVFITHDLNEALRIGDRIAIMKGGRFVQIGSPTDIVTEPEDQYVADFIQDVDQGRVLEVSFVMSEAPIVRLGEVDVGGALSRLKGTEMRGLYVVDPERRPVGLLTSARLAKAEDDGITDIDLVMLREFPETHGDMSIREIYDLCARGWPVAVLGRETGKLQGVVDPLDLLGKMGAIDSVEPVDGSGDNPDEGQADHEVVSA